MVTIPFSHPATSLSISPSGQTVALAGKRGLFLFALDSPLSPPIILEFHTKWDVVDIQWNPHRPDWIASTSNHSVLIWDIQKKQGKFVERTLSGHGRAVSDLNWSPFHPDLLSTCGMDGKILVWDLRLPSTMPATQFVVWNSSASHVKFARRNEFALASTHEGDVKVWDMRKPGAVPTHSISAAHTSKIYGLDWSRKTSGEFVTCGQDSLVKSWSTEGDSRRGQFVGQISTRWPVWRARHAPFGDSIVVLPQQVDSNLYLYKKSQLTTPIHTFSGHVEPARDFVWRINGILNSTNSGSYYSSEFDLMGEEFQLVTWGKDDTIRTWDILPQVLQKCGHEPPQRSSLLAKVARHRRLSSTGNTVSPSTASKPSPADRDYFSPKIPDSPKSSPTSPLFQVPVLKLENDFGGYFDDVEDDVPEDSYPIPTPVSSTPHDLAHELEAISRLAHVEWQKTELGVLLQVFPHSLSWTSLEVQPFTLLLRINVNLQGYPIQPAVYTLEKTASLSLHTRHLIGHHLQSISQSMAEQGLPSLEHITKMLVTPPENQDDQSISSASDVEDTEIVVPEMQSARSNVPYPRLSGGILSATGHLILWKSPIPHPSQTNFTTQTLVTRNQQPVLQSTTFVHQPKNMSMYLAYQKHLLERIQANKSLTREESEWMDESDEEDKHVPSFFWKESREEGGKLGRLLARQGLNVTLLDYTDLLPVDIRLAREYTMQGSDPLAICCHNAQVAEKYGRMDLAQLWSLAGILVTKSQLQLLSPGVDPTQPPLDTLFHLNPQGSVINPWGVIESVEVKPKESIPGVHLIYGRPNFSTHPLGRFLVHLLFDYLDKSGDLQTKAMLTCVLSEPFPPGSFRREMINAVLQRNAGLVKTLPRRSALTQGIKDWRGTPLNTPVASLNMSNIQSVPLSTSPDVASSPSSASSISSFLTSWIPGSSWMKKADQVVEPKKTQDGFSIQQHYIDDSESAFPPLFVPLQSVSTYASDFYQSSYLEPEKRDWYDGARRGYADMLARWGLWTGKTQIDQFLTRIRGEDVMDSIGGERCGVCRLPVKGVLASCSVCGQCGHLRCFEKFEHGESCQFVT